MSAYGIYCPYCGKSGCSKDPDICYPEPCTCEGNTFCRHCGFNGMSASIWRELQKAWSRMNSEGKFNAPQN